MNLKQFDGTSIGRVAIDFDGTIATNTWPSPELGDPIETGINLILVCEELGYEVVIYTARPLSHQQRIIEWLYQEGLDEIVYDVVCGKIQADLYIDDRAYNPFTGVGDGSAASSLATSSDGGRSKAAADPSLCTCAGEDRGFRCWHPSLHDAPFQGEFGPIDLEDMGERPL